MYRGDTSSICIQITTNVKQALSSDPDFDRTAFYFLKHSCCQALNSSAGNEGNGKLYLPLTRRKYARFYYTFDKVEGHSFVLTDVSIFDVKPCLRDWLVKHSDAILINIFTGIFVTVFVAVSATILKEVVLRI